MTTIFYILIAFCLFFEVLNLAACKKVFAAAVSYTHLDVYKRQEAYTALMEIYSKSSENKRYRDFLAVRRFIKCNFGLYDNVIDIDENWNFRFEFVGCPLRGECKSDKIICAPKFNSKLSDRQLEVMRLLYEGKSDSEIADKLFISLNTVNNHRKNSFRKVGVHSFPEFMRYAMQNLSLIHILFTQQR